MKVATLQQLLNCCWCPNWCCSTGAAERKHLLGPWIRKRRWKQKTSGSRRILVTSRPAASIHCTTSTIPAVRMRRFIVFSLLLSAYSGRADATVRFSETHPANASSAIAEELDAEADSPRGYRRPPPHHPPPPSKRQRRYPYSDFLSQVLEPFFRPEGGSPFYDGYGIDPYYYPPHPNDHYIEPPPPIHHSIRHCRRRPRVTTHRTTSNSPVNLTRSNNPSGPIATTNEVHLHISFLVKVTRRSQLLMRVSPNQMA